MNGAEWRNVQPSLAPSSSAPNPQKDKRQEGWELSGFRCSQVKGDVIEQTWKHRWYCKYSFTVIMRVPHSCKGNLQHFMWKRLGHTGWMAMCVGPRNFAHHFGTLWKGPRGLLHTWWAVSVKEEVDHPAVILKVEGSRPQGNHGVRSRDPSWPKKSVVVVWLEMSHQ